MHRTTVNKPESPLMVLVTAEDANNYCRILTLLGMEEEGDPVAEVERLAAHPANQVLQEPVAWAEPLQMATLGPEGDDYATVKRVRSIRFCQPLYASPQAVPSEQPIAAPAEQPATPLREVLSDEQEKRLSAAWSVVKRYGKGMGFVSEVDDALRALLAMKN